MRARSQATLRNTMKIIPIVLFMLATTTAAAQYATSVKSTKVAPGFFMVEGIDGSAGGNLSLLVGTDYVVMIDDGYEPTAPIVLEHVSRVAGKPINFVINTHVHGDHTGGNAHFVNNGVVMFAHDNVRKRLLENPEISGGETGLPVITFGEGVTFHLNGLEARAFHIPKAHTDGDTAIYFPDVNVIHAADIMFNHMFPYIDLDNGGTVDGFIAGQKRLLAMADDDTIIIPGHGKLGTKADLRRDLLMLTDSQARVKMLVDQGRTIEDVLLADPLSVYHDDYDWRFISTELMTRTLYRALTSGE